MRILQMLRKHEQGQALVETAITLPLLLLLLMGIMEFGWYFYNQMSVENGSREGARYAIVNKDSASLTTDVTDRSTPMSFSTVGMGSFWKFASKLLSLCIFSTISSIFALISIGILSSLKNMC